MNRRGHGEGTIFQRSDGLWCASISLGIKEDGRYRRRAAYCKTRQEAIDALNRLKQDVAKGSSPAPVDLTVGTFLDKWLDDVVKPERRIKTHRSYKGIVDNHVRLVIGWLPLGKLAPIHIQDLYSKMQKLGASPRLRELTHAVLHAALEKAVRWRYLQRNPCDDVDRPRAPRKEVKALTEEQAQAFLSAARGDRLNALYVLALTSGMRFGELLGLRWQDIDFSGGTVAVRRTLQELGSELKLGEPKSKSGNRSIALPAMALTALQEHKKRYAAERKRVSPWVFCDRNGNWLRQSNVTRRSFRPILKRAKLPQIRFHDLRHTAATLLLLQGTHPKVVQERLGHHKVSVTLDIYSHVLPSMQREAADKLDSMLANSRTTQQA